MKTNNNNSEKYNINYVVNANGREKSFSFSAAKKHFTNGLSALVNRCEGRYLQKKGNKVLVGIAEERHYNLDRNALQNKAFLTCRTALQKGKLPKGYKEKDIKEVCFSAVFIATLEKCQCKTGFNSDKLLFAVSKAIAQRIKEEKKSKKSKK